MVLMWCRRGIGIWRFPGRSLPEHSDLPCEAAGWIIGLKPAAPSPPWRLLVYHPKDTEIHNHSGARQGGVRVVGWPPWMLDQGQWPPCIWAIFRIFYQVIFPVNKQGSIESPPRKQRLENDAKEREKQTIVAKTVSRPNNASSDRRSLKTFHRTQSVGPV